MSLENNMIKPKQIALLLFCIALLIALLVSVVLANYWILTDLYFIGESKCIAFFLLNMGFIELTALLLIIGEALLRLFKLLK